MRAGSAESQGARAEWSPEPRLSKGLDVDSGSHSVRVGPVLLSVPRDHVSLTTELRALTEGYKPGPERTALSRVARVELDSCARADAHRPAGDPEFVYHSAHRAYVAPTQVADLCLQLGGDETVLRAEFHPGQVAGVSFPGFLLRMVTTTALVQANALLVHGCAMVSPTGEATLFLGASGDGKTTMTRRLPGWKVLADDTVLIEGMPGHGALYVSGTPYAGREGLPRCGERVELTRLVVLHPHAASLSFTSLGVADGLQALLKRVFCPLIDGPIPIKVVDLATRVSERVTTYRLSSDLSHDLIPLFDKGTA
ncbi:MAG: hypothetical protein ACPGU1_03515 [Myxococcota bacterium]